MAELLYNKIAKNLKNTSFNAPAFLSVSGVVIVVLIIGIADYLTSVYGYQNTPSAKILPYIEWFIGALPQLIQVGTMYIIIGLGTSDEGDEDRNFYGLNFIFLAFVAWLAAYLIDGYWDYLYKEIGYIEKGLTPDLYGYYSGALFEAYGLYGILSEVLFTLFGGIWIAMFRQGAFDDTLDLFEEMGEAFGRLIGVIRNLFGRIIGAFVKGVKVKPVNNKTKSTKSTNHHQSQNRRKDSHGYSQSGKHQRRLP